jgi:hypothetical protein
MRGLIPAGLHPIQSSSYPTLASSQVADGLLAEHVAIAVCSE